MGKPPRPLHALSTRACSGPVAGRACSSSPSGGTASNRAREGKETYKELVGGKTKLTVDESIIGDAKTEKDKDGTKTIILKTLGTDKYSKLSAGVYLQHEAYRDGKEKTEEERSPITREAVRARTEMALRLSGDSQYGLDYLFAEKELMQDALVYSVSIFQGDELFDKYIDENFDSKDEYARKYKNWEKTGKIGVFPGDTNPILHSAAASLRLLGLAENEGASLTELPPNAFQDAFTVTTQLITVGQAAASSTTIKEYVTKSVFGLMGLAATKDEFATIFMENAIYRVLGGVDTNFTEWHDEKNRDIKIFSMAKELGISLSVDYEQGMDDTVAQTIERQLINRYYTLGNLMFNENITNPEELKMIMYGVYEPNDVYVGQTIEGKDSKLGVLCTQFQLTEGYLHSELRKYEYGDWSWGNSKYYKDREDDYDILNKMLIHNQIKIIQRLGF